MSQKYDILWKCLNENNVFLLNSCSANLCCAYCKQFMKDARQIPCGCGFCANCVEIYFNTTDKACPNPICGSDMYSKLMDVSIDHRSNNLISKLIAKCPNYKCTYQNELLELSTHINQCKTSRQSQFLSLGIKSGEDDEDADRGCPFENLGCSTHTNDSEGVTEHLHRNVKAHSRILVNALENATNETESLRTRLEVSEQQVALLTSELQSLASSSELRHCDYVWRLDNFSSSSSVNYFTSKSFLSDRYGYKMCLMAYPRGYGDGANSYFSVFVQLQRGKYDDLLQWPIDKEVTFSLLEPSGKKTYSRKLDAKTFIKSPETRTFGITKFIFLRNLEATYIIKGTVYIKCTVK